MFARREFKTVFHHDWETYSDIDLTKTSNSRYARHPSTVPLLLAYAFDDESVQQWAPAEGQPMPRDVHDAMRDSSVQKAAFNVAMEWSVWQHTLGVETPHEEWMDVMVQVHSLAFPGSLEAAGEALDLPLHERKKGSGKRLINWFCLPRSRKRGEPPRRVMWHERPEDWELFKDYNRQDVDAERAIGKLVGAHDLPPHEWEMWFIDREINERGVPVNRNVVNRALMLRDYFHADRYDELQRLSGVDNPVSGKQILSYLQHLGYPFDDLKKGHVERALKSAKMNATSNVVASQQYIRALELRQEISRVSSKKYDAFALRADEDGRLRQSLQFAGAGRTWRWGGRGVQLHNLPRPDPKFSKVETEKTPGGLKVVTGGPLVDCIRDIEHMMPEEFAAKYNRPFDVLATAIRSVIQPAPGNMLVVFDLNAIENRGLGWVAREPKINQVFSEGRCPYMDFATDLYSMPYDAIEREYKSGNKDKRQNAKPAVLGCGYLLGAGYEYEDPATGAIEATGLLGYARNMFIDLSPEMSEKSVKIWRRAHPYVKRFWTDIENAAIQCVNTGLTQQVQSLQFRMQGQFLKMDLPSGRSLSYYRPEVRMMRKPWGDLKPTLTYMGKDYRGQWVRLTTHPGKLTENAVQAIARDVLAAAIRLLRTLGYQVVLHVHDEAVVECRIEDVDIIWPVIRQCMIAKLPWTPDLVLEAEGFGTYWYLKE